MASPAPKYYSERTAKNWSELKNLLLPLESNWGFRGQGDSSWNLETSLERAWRGQERDIAEKVAFAEYRRKASGLRGSRLTPTNSVSLLAEMQHFGAPTRLQDWTKSFYVAAYFAFETQRDAKEVAVWAIELAWLKGTALRKMQKADKTCRKLTIRDDLGTPHIVDHLILNNRASFVLPLTAFDMNERLGIQQGLFLCPGDVTKTFTANLLETDKAELAKKCLKFRLSMKCRAEVLADLRKMNISAATLFPGLDGFARSLNAELFLLSQNHPMLNKVRGGVKGALIYL